MSRRPNGTGAQGPHGDTGPQGPAGPGFSGTQYQVVGTGDFVPQLGTWDLSMGFSNGNGGVYRKTTTNDFWLVAPVHLPEGAHVSGVEIQGNDELVGVDLRIRVKRLFHSGVTFNQPVNVVSSGDTGPFVINASPSFNVTNTDRMIYVDVQPDGGDWDAGGKLAIKAVIFEYTLD